MAFHPPAFLLFLKEFYIVSRPSCADVNDVKIFERNVWNRVLVKIPHGTLVHEEHLVLVRIVVDPATWCAVLLFRIKIPKIDTCFPEPPQKIRREVLTHVGRKIGRCAKGGRIESDVCPGPAKEGFVLEDLCCLVLQGQELHSEDVVNVGVAEDENPFSWRRRLELAEEPFEFVLGRHGSDGGMRFIYLF